MADKKERVVIVGAGMSALAAAASLRALSYDVVVVEASDYVGGRVRSVEGFAEWRLDLGGEFIHGSNTTDKALADRLKLPYREVFQAFDFHDGKPLREFIYLAKEKRLLSINSTDPDIVACNELPNNRPESDQSLLEYLHQRQVPYRVIGLVDALIAKTWSSSIDKIGVHALIREDEYDDQKGPENYRLNGSFFDIVQHLKRSLDIRLNWRVRHINHSSPKSITIKSESGDTLQASKVIITVPVTVLRDGDITFQPALPENKVHVLKKIVMEPAIKIIVKFTHRFWPENHSLVICADSFVPQYWTDTSMLRGISGPERSCIVVGFLSGDQARVASTTFTHSQLVERFLQQLDEIYSLDLPMKRPASASYVDYYIFDWLKHPYVRGAYSSPTIGLEDATTILAQPINKRIFFAGEATATGSVATVNGALTSGLRAAIEVSKSKEDFKVLVARL